MSRVKGKVGAKAKVVVVVRHVSIAEEEEVNVKTVVVVIFVTTDAKHIGAKNCGGCQHGLHYPLLPATQIVSYPYSQLLCCVCGQKLVYGKFSNQTSFTKYTIRTCKCYIFLLNATMTQGWSLVLLSIVNLQIRWHQAVTIAAISTIAGVSLSNGTWGRRRT